MDVYYKSHTAFTTVADIPTKIQVCQNTFKLEGMILYVAPFGKNTRKSRNKENVDFSVQHYTAAIYYEDRTWTEIDDLKIGEFPLKNKDIQPHVIIYSKIT